MLLTLRFYSQKPFFVTALASLPLVVSSYRADPPRVFLAAGSHEVSHATVAAGCGVLRLPSTPVHWLAFQYFLCEYENEHTVLDYYNKYGVHAILIIHK
ncbi:hypothetical protein NCCP2331_15990 [Sporosarcina sp. NCCP-2331]|nr:hypothetical protein NCCP2331_15990 [Sporosarcina sp. NCCP-2331]GLB55570.1 hypothetical protein NCCP2378_13570 [Sporosarcina sp. NCCP-2378]